MAILKRGLWFVLFVCGVVRAEGLIERDVLEVEGRNADPAQVAVWHGDVASVLSELPGVDLLWQGAPGSQNDLSIRGSGFSGAGISLNGFSLPNAQTEHFNAELPLPPEILSPPLVYTGFDQNFAGDGHLIGTVGFSMQPLVTGGHLVMGLSEKEGYWGRIMTRQRWLMRDSKIGVGAFAGTYGENAVDYEDNDLRVKRVGGQIQRIDRLGGQWDVLIARQEKTFGVRGYYGVTPLWPGTESLEDTFMFAGWSRRDNDGNHYRVSVLYREQHDDYKLFWTLPGNFQNRHKLETYGFSADSHQQIGRRGILDWRVTGTEQGIRSSALGEHRRSQMGVMLLPGFVTDKWRLQSGGRLEVFEDSINRFLPQVSANRKLSERVFLVLAYSESVRQPSYTELNYESPSSLGNSGLDNQMASSVDFYLQGGEDSRFSWKAGLFHQTVRHAVDWVREQQSSSRWEAQNIGSVDAVGVEGRLSWKALNGSRLMMHYAGLKKDGATDYYASRYLLDYPEHLLQISGYGVIHSRFGVEVAQQFRQQASHPLRESRTGYPARLALHMLLLEAPRVQLTLAVNNLWKDDYEMFAGQATVTPQRFSAGVRADW